MKKNKAVIGILLIAALFAIFYAFLCYAWIGAEYRIEGDVHFGKVDRMAVFAICAITTSYIFSSAKHRSESTNGKYVHV